MNLNSNMRAPYYIDNSFSGQIKRKEIARNIELQQEKMQIILPRFHVNSIKPYSMSNYVSFDVTYVLYNKSKSTMRVPIEFLALNIHKPVVKINGEKVNYKLVENKKNLIEFYKKLKKHRLNWKPKIYKYYKSRVEGLKYQDYDRKFVPKELQFDAFGFTVELKPGVNKLNVYLNYKSTFIDEGTPNYNTFNSSRAVFGFDYLFYPALSWKKSSDFKLNIEVELPDFIKRGNIGDDYFEAQYNSNLKFSAEYDNRNHKTILKAEYDDFPADIFTLLFNKGKERD